MNKSNLDWNKVQELINTGFISAHRHPTAPYTIYNYTTRCSYAWNWTPETMACRGLILHDDGSIIARPFPKFFSVEQRMEPLPNEPFQVFEKSDGSMGIGYSIDGVPYIATRGNFTGKQAIWATEHLKTKYPSVRFEQDRTYLFEIIYPADKVVVDYGGLSDLILLAVIDNETGRDLPLPIDSRFPAVRRYSEISDISQLASLDDSNREGFVLLFKSGLRVKWKFERYKRLHYLLTSVTPRDIWQAMQEKDGLLPLLEDVPDEYYSWVRGVESGLKSQYATIQAQCESDFKGRIEGDRKEIASFFKACPYPSILFKMLDGKDASDLIWKRIYPEASKPFREGVDG